MVKIVGADDLNDDERKRLLLSALGAEPLKARVMVAGDPPGDVRRHGERRHGAPLLGPAQIEFHAFVVAPSAPPAPRWTWIRWVGSQPPRFFTKRQQGTTSAPLYAAG